MPTTIKIRKDFRLSGDFAVHPVIKQGGVVVKFRALERRMMSDLMLTTKVFTWLVETLEDTFEIWG